MSCARHRRQNRTYERFAVDACHIGLGAKWCILSNKAPEFRTFKCCQYSGKACGRFGVSTPRLVRNTIKMGHK